MTAWWPDTFQEPGRRWFLLVIAGIALLYVVASLLRRTYTVKFTNLPLLDSVAPRRPGWRRHVTAGAFLLAASLMILTWARPSDLVDVPKERATVILAIDTSLSMEATDVRPSRIDAAKEAAMTFVDSLPEEYNLGLVSFDGVARVQVTPTVEREPVRRAIAALELGEATAIGEAILAGLQAIESAPVAEADGEPIPAVMVVMTDGKTTVGRPDATGVEAAVEADVPISTIAFGTANGSIVIEGEIQPVPVEIDALRSIADETNGRFFQAASVSELEAVYTNIGSSIGFEQEEVEVTDRWAGYALVAMALSSALSLLWFQRLP